VSATANVVFVHHANQFIITDGYANRDGISVIAEGYERVLRRHEELDIPAGLHLSGTLLEALAWYRPRFLVLVKSLIDKGVISLIGGTYAENVMTEWPDGFNRRQLVELFALYDDLLGCPPQAISTFWLPERVWDERLAEVLADPTLPNGGYRAVLLDDRLWFSPEPDYERSPRARFDAAGPYESPGPVGISESPAGPRSVCRIAGGRGLLAVPISADLRYCIPPRGPQDWARIKRKCVESLGELVVFADDLERTAGVGGWADHSHAFGRLLGWVASNRSCAVARRIDEVIAPSDEISSARVHRGTFCELEREWGAGDDYRGWTGSPAWAPYKRIYEHTISAVRTAEEAGADKGLVELAWKHVLASSHETGWQDPLPGEAGRAPAPWARAVASHSRAALVMVDAARRLPVATTPLVEIVDVDEDGHQEIVLSNGDCYAAITPRFGARLVYMFHRITGGYTLSVGNPTDHWNFQQSLNRHMDRPPNHPCAFTDAGGENDPYDVCGFFATDNAAGITLENVGAGSLRGLRKSFLLLAAPPGIVVCYRTPDHGNFITQTCLSPDYCSLLRTGRRNLRERRGGAWTALTNRDVTVWLGTAVDEITVDPQRPDHDVGHGINYVLRCETSHAHIAIGWDNVNDEVCRDLLESGRKIVHTRVEVAGKRELEGVY
jgi:starch synthase